jgi:hypothetical protein
MLPLLVSCKQRHARVVPSTVDHSFSLHSHLSLSLSRSRSRALPLFLFLACLLHHLRALYAHFTRTQLLPQTPTLTAPASPIAHLTPSHHTHHSHQSPTPHTQHSMHPPRRTLTSSGPAGNSAMFSNNTGPPTSTRKPPLRSSGLPRASMAAHPYASVSRQSTAAGEGPLQKRRSMMPPSRPADNLLSASASRGDGGLTGRTPQSGRALTQ